MIGRPETTNRKALEVRTQRIRELVVNLDPDWLALVSKLVVENCPVQRERQQADDPILPVPFNFVCDRRWVALELTDTDTVRHCAGCDRDVHYCDTIIDARKHAWQGHCIALDIGVIRRDRDLEPLQRIVGMVDPKWSEAESRRMQPDDVSAVRLARRGSQDHFPYSG